MAATPAKTPSKHLLRSQSQSSPAPPIPLTPQSLPTPRRSTRLFNSIDLPATPKTAKSRENLSTPSKHKPITKTVATRSNGSTDKHRSEPFKQRNRKVSFEIESSFAPASPAQSESKKRKREDEVERTIVTRAIPSRKQKSKSEKRQKSNNTRLLPKKRVYYKKVVYDGGEFEVGDDVYVKRREDGSSDEEDSEVEECRLCFDSGSEVMIECDDCLGGFHLKCFTPPLKEVPEGDWICGFCEDRKMGKEVHFPKPPEGKKLVRTMRQKLLSSDLWAAHIESIWKEVDGSYWCRVRWYTIPEETSVGRQPHNLSRELYRTNDLADIEMESVLRHCNVMTPKEYAKASNEGDDIFLMRI